MLAALGFLAIQDQYTTARAQYLSQHKEGGDALGILLIIIALIIVTVEHIQIKYAEEESKRKK